MPGRLRFLLLVLTSTCAFSGDALDTLVKARVLTLPPDLERAKVHPDGAVASGDLFKRGRRVAVALAVADGRSLGFACFVHKNGDWREIARHALSEGDQRLGSEDEWPFAFADVDGDAKPELLVSEQGNAEDRMVRVFRYDAETDTLVAAGSGLRNPAWRDGAVRGQWRTGPTAGDTGVEQHRWVDGRLRLEWRSIQRHSLHEYLIGGGEPAVRVQLDLADAAGVLTSTTVVGNLASYRNRLPANEPPRPFQVLVRESKGRRLVEVVPRSDALRTAQRTAQWEELVSRALFRDPAAFSRDMSVTLADQAAVKLADLATVSVTPATAAPTYQFLPISDEVRRTVQEPGELPALAAANSGAIDWTRMDEATRAWADAAASTMPLRAADDVLLFLRLPNLGGFAPDEVEAGTLVTGLTLGEHTVQLTVTMAPGQKPTRPSKEVVRPLLGLSLGRLAKGAYRVDATISGHPAGALAVVYPFTVE